MDPSWTGASGHTYPGHTGMDVGYFYVTSENEYNNYRDKLPSVLAAASGKVIFVKSDEGDGCGKWLLTDQQQKDMNNKPTAARFPKSDDCGGGCNYPNGNCAGNYVVIDHDPEEDKGLLDRVGYRYSAYYHLQKGSSMTPSVGDWVDSVDEIGKMGSSGQSLTPHLHFEVHKEAIDVGNPSAWNWEEFQASMVDPFYSLHDGSNNRGSGGSSMWQDQCSEEHTAKYGRVIQGHALSAFEYELDSGSINPRYLVTGKENHNGPDPSEASGRAGIASGDVDYDESESWRACGRDITPSPCPDGQLLVDGECK